MKRKISKPWLKKSRFLALVTLLCSAQDVDDVIADVDEQLENTWDKEHEDEKGEFELLEKAPSYHHFFSTPAGGVKPSTAPTASVPASVAEFVMKKDIPLLRSSLPAGITQGQARDNFLL